MNVIKAIKQRNSCRDFSGQQISKEDLDILINSALASPTAMNLQDLKINVIQNEKLIRDISDECFRLMDSTVLERMKSRNATTIFYNAPTVFILSAPETIYADLNAGIAAQSITLTAHSIGLGSCIIGMASLAFDKENVNNFNDQLSIAENEHFCLAIAVGYANSNKEPHQLDKNQIRIFK